VNTARGIAPFLQKFAIQAGVLHALMMREIITRFGRDNLGVLWLVGEPMIFTLCVTPLWSPAGWPPGPTGMPIVAFAVTGYSSVLMWRNATSQCSAGIEQNKPLLFHRSVLIIDVFFTRIALEIIGATSSFIVLSIFFISIGWMPMPVDLLLVIEGWLMLAWFGASLALLVGGGTAFSNLVHRLWHPLAYLLFPMSGAAFMVEWLPKRLQDAVLYLPMVHGVELLRRGYFGNVVRSHYDISYMATCCLVLSLCGLYVVREASRRVEF
jgi:capsular polysaccharide transport system permease protein